MAKEIDAITRLYDYILWAIPKIDQFPRNRKFTLGDRIENLLLDMLSLLIEAAFSRNKSDLLKAANLKLEQLRYLTRLAKDLRLLKKENTLAMRRRLKKMSFQYRAGEISLDNVNQRIQSWIGHAQHADSWHLRRRLFAESVFQRGEAKSASRGFVEQQPEQRALRQPQQQPPEQPEQQHRFSLLQDM